MDKKLNDEFADNCIYIVENLNFLPEEFGYIEPDFKLNDIVSEKDEVLSKSKGVKSIDMDRYDNDDEDYDCKPFNNKSIHNFKKRLG